MLIYKILRPGEWDAFEAAGRFDGSPDDLRDGFVHCSTREQLGRTALRHFADEPDLVVAVLDGDAVGEWLRWEPSSNGDRFPHVYASTPSRRSHT